MFTQLKPKNLHYPPSNPSNNQIQENVAHSMANIVNLIVNNKFGDAFAQCNRLKLHHLLQITKMIYEYNHLKYVLVSKDKVLQVNAEHHLLTDAGMSNIRALALYRQQAAQAKLTYQALVENIKQIISSPSNFYKCTLPNKQQFAQLRNALNNLFQQIKNIRRQKVETAVDKGKESSIVNQCKESILEMISFLVPTQTLRKSSNRQKSISQLGQILKKHIRQAFLSHKTQLEVLQSKVKMHQVDLEEQRVIVLEKELEIVKLKEQLAKSDQIIGDLQGIKAATQMQNLGLHSRIGTTSDSDEEKHQYERQIQKLKQQVEQLSNTNLKQSQKYVHQLQELKSQHLWEMKEINLKFQLKEINLSQGYICKIESLQQANQQLRQRILKQQKSILELQKHLQQMGQMHKQIHQQIQMAKQEKERVQQLHQQMQQKYQECMQEVNRLNQEIESQQYQIVKLQKALSQEEQKNHSNQHQIEQLVKIIAQNDEERHRAGESVQVLSKQNLKNGDMIWLLSERLKEAQEELQYVSAEKNYYYQYYHRMNSVSQSTDIST